MNDITTDWMGVFKHSVLLGLPIGLLWGVLWQPMTALFSGVIGAIASPLAGLGLFALLETVLGVSSVLTVALVIAGVVWGAIVLWVLQSLFKTKFIPKYYRYLCLLGVLFTMPLGIVVAIPLTWIYKYIKWI